MNSALKPLFSRRPSQPPSHRLSHRLSPARLFALATAMLFTCAWAVHAAAQPVPGDPPGRVARLADVEGPVWVWSPDTNEWRSARRNQPLTTGDRLATDAGARAELQVGSTTVRLDASTELDVALLDDARFSMQLRSGSVAARVRDTAEAGRVDVATADGRFLMQRAGRYRVDRGARSSFVTVYAGQAYFEGQGTGLAVQPGQRAEFFVDQNNVAQYGLAAPVNDAFANWSNARDRARDRSPPVRYVSPEMTGADELDRYGRWEQNPEYGALWVPQQVAVDWVPYSTGHWAWVRPWGWTWVDDAPWGFAPFHYGRWVNVRNTWCWTPGVRVVQPVYAPALVAWVGGPQLSVSINIGGGGQPAVGWFPLAPREVFVPGYQASPRYAQNINITNVTNVTNITTVINNPQAPREFQNRHLPNALVVVPATVLTGREPVAAAAAQWRQARGDRGERGDRGDRGDRGEQRHAESAPVLISAPVAAPPAVTAAARSAPLPVGRGEERRGSGDRGGDRGGDARDATPPPPRDAARPPVMQPAQPVARTPPAGAPPTPSAVTPPAPVAVPPAPAVAAPVAPQRTPDDASRAPRGENRRGEFTPPAERGIVPGVVRPALPQAVPAPAVVAAPAAPPAPAPPAPTQTRPPVTAPAVAAAPAVRAPAPREAAPEKRVLAPVPMQEVPTMRPQPVRRGEERSPAAARPAEPPHTEPARPRAADAALKPPAAEPSKEQPKEAGKAPREDRRGERER